MSAVAAAPPAIRPRPVRFTVAEFRQLRETGVWDGRRAILIDGTVWELGPMNTPHAVAVELALAALQLAFGPGWRVRVQLPVECGEGFDPFPDLSVVPGSPRDSLPAHPDARSVALLVEVADTSFDLDTTTKAERYAVGGVADYWVLDLENRRLLVLRDPAPVAANGHSYRSQQAFGPAESVAPLAAPGVAIRVADLLP